MLFCANEGDPSTPDLNQASSFSILPSWRRPDRPTGHDRFRQIFLDHWHRWCDRRLEEEVPPDQRAYACEIILLDDFRPANEREENPATALLLQLATFYADLQPDTVAGDAGLGYDVFLRTVYQLGAKRVIDLRAHPTDQDKTLWPIRGYDDKGRPVCPFGYALTANGFDSDRRRHKWFCDQACLKNVTPVAPVDGALYPPDQCPFQTADHPHGKIINVGERFTDNSIRLVRDIPVGTPTWKSLYHRARNATESRNATIEGWDFKRLPLYGLPRGKALIFLADVWSNLTTLARLVREATTAAGFT